MTVLKQYAYLDLNLMEKVCHGIAVAYLNKDNDPIAPFSTCDMALLDSALNVPKHAFGGHEFHAELEDKAAALYYSLIKNHAFQNGNKRIATVSLLVFLDINGYWIYGMQEELAEWAIKIAESRNKMEIQSSFKEWLSSKMVAVG